MIETQQSVATWANSTFGEPRSALSILLRANEEMAELLRAVEREDYAAARLEVADVVIVLFRWAECVGEDLLAMGDLLNWMYKTPMSALLNVTYMNRLLARAIDHVAGTDVVQFGMHEFIWRCGQAVPDLRAAIDEKMAINRARTWQVDDGHGRHV